MTKYPELTKDLGLIRDRVRVSLAPSPGPVVRVGFLAEEHKLPVVVPLAHHDGGLARLEHHRLEGLDVGPCPHGDLHWRCVSPRYPFFL